MRALITAINARHLDADLRLVVSSHGSARGIDIARHAGITVEVADYRDYSSRDRFDAALDDVLSREQPDLVVLAGFMRILGAEFVARWYRRLINIHPSLLPRHPGLDTHRRVIVAGDRTHGASVHLVTSAVDAGAILGQASFTVRPDDDEPGLRHRTLRLEHRLYPAVLQKLIADGYIHDRGIDLDRLTPHLPLIRWHE